MYLAGTKIQTNIQLPKQAQYNEKVRCMMLGFAGVGKSLLFNKVCNGQQKVGYAQQIITKVIKQGQCVSLPNNCMQIYDSPGIIQESNKGLLQIQRALHFLQWNLIIILVKYEVRYKVTTIPQIKKLCKIFKQCKPSQILIMVSYIDIVDDSSNKGTTFNKFAQALKQNELKYNFILFSNLQSDFKIISQLIYNCGLQNVAQNIQITSKSIQRCLNCESFNDQHRQKLQKYFQQLSQDIQNIKQFQIIAINKKIKQKILQIVKEQNQDDILGLIQIFEGSILNKLQAKAKKQSLIINEKSKILQISKQTINTIDNKQTQQNKQFEQKLAEYCIKEMKMKIGYGEKLMPKDGRKYQNKNLSKTFINHSYIKQNENNGQRQKICEVRKSIWQSAGLWVS